MRFAHGRNGGSPNANTSGASTTPPASILARQPLVSVGIPTYNRPAGLRRTLDCITRQTYRNLEIIVSDNGSPTDEPAAIVREMQQRDGRVRFFRQSPAVTVHDNFRFVLSQAHGEFYFWAADDDEWSAEFVELCLPHLASVGSVMTNMRTSVRPRRLMQPRPTIQISSENSPFENAVEFLATFPSSLFYGIHRRETIQDFLTDPAYDYCYATFVLRQILRHGFHVVPAIAHTVGIDSEDYQLKPVWPRSGAMFEYLPFMRHASAEIWRCGRITTLEKLRLLALLSLSICHDFVQFETSVRPWQATVVKLSLKLLKLCGSLLRVPVSHRGSKQNLPDDPAELCYFVFPADQLDEPEGLRRQIILARSQLHEKEAVLNRMRYDWTQSRVYSKWRRRLRRLLGKSSPKVMAMQISETESDQASENNAGAAVGELRRELGLLWRRLVAREAEIQSLAKRFPTRRAA